jgi:uncharacterized protein YuzE
MEKIKLFDNDELLNWDYDEVADVLYLSFSEPKNAFVLDIGEGTVVRYVEITNSLIGLTIINFKNRMMTAICIPQIHQSFHYQ